jgi:hypothetical protein
MMNNAGVWGERKDVKKGGGVKMKLVGGNGIRRG